MSKLDELSDEHDYENPNPAIKKSFKSSFLSNFKSGKSKIISKLSSSPTSLDDTKCKSKQFDHEIGDLDSSLYYPVSSSSTLNNDSAETRKILRKTKTIRHKPVVNAFLKNSSFSSSSTSTSPPSPFSVHKNRRNKISKPSLTDLVNIPDTLDSSLDIQSDKESEDKKSFFNSSIETQNSFEQNKTKHRNMESGKSKLAKNVCSGSSHSKNELFNSDYDEEDFMDAFRIFDINGDGKITAKELKNVLKELGIKIDKNDVKKMIKELDKDGNGTIEYSEFVQMMTTPASRDDDEFELREAFKCIDLDGNGYISREELKKAVQKIMSTDGKVSMQDVEEMMKEADTDGNGLIDYDEFVRILVEKR